MWGRTAASVQNFSVAPGGELPTMRGCEIAGWIRGVAGYRWATADRHANTSEASATNGRNSRGNESEPHPRQGSKQGMALTRRNRAQN